MCKEKLTGLSRVKGLQIFFIKLRYFTKARKQPNEVAVAKT
jgi:hypothetical protein